MNFGYFFESVFKVPENPFRFFAKEMESFLIGERRIGIKLLLIYFLITTILYLISNFQRKNLSFKNLFRFIFPGKIYSHPSYKMDLKIFFVYSIFNPATSISFLIITTILSGAISKFLIGIYPPTWARFELTSVNLMVLGFIGFLVFDFGQYLIHFFSHKSRIFWPFHAPHHSAEVLTPFTILREHFVWAIFDGLCFFSLMGVAQGIFIWAANDPINAQKLFQFNLYFNIFNYAVGNLHHSHFWISFGFLDRIFVSPAMHQIHHSVDIKHRNKNFGYFLSIWDQMFGTIYVPKEKEKLVYGIEKGVKNPHDTLLKFYFLPFKESGLVIKKKFQSLWNIPVLVKKKYSVAEDNEAKKKGNPGIFQEGYNLK